MEASTASCQAHWNTRCTIHLYIQPSESLEGKKAPCHRLRLFNSLTLRIYKLKVSSGTSSLCNCNISWRGRANKLLCWRAFVCWDVATLCKGRENILHARIPHPRHLTAILLADTVAFSCYLRTAIQMGWVSFSFSCSRHLQHIVIVCSCQQWL